MKAERRHELKGNELAKKLEKTPHFLQQYGSKILLGITIVVLGYVLWNNHEMDASKRQQVVARNMGDALFALMRLRSIGTTNQDGIAMLRKQSARDVEVAVAAVLSNTEDTKIRAAALAVKGDLNWELANFPPLPGAATRPELNPERPSDTYLTDAAAAYNEILQSAQDADELSVVSARVGLAKIAENRSNWDEARKYYQQIIDDSSTAKEFKDLARGYIDKLKDLQKPVYVGDGHSTGPSDAIPGPKKPEVLTVTPPADFVPPGGSTTQSATAPTTQATQYLLQKSTIQGPQPVLTVPANATPSTGRTLDWSKFETTRPTTVPAH